MVVLVGGDENAFNEGRLMTDSLQRELLASQPANSVQFDLLACLPVGRQSC